MLGTGDAYILKAHMKTEHIIRDDCLVPATIRLLFESFCIGTKNGSRSRAYLSRRDLARIKARCVVALSPSMAWLYHSNTGHGHNCSAFYALMKRRRLVPLQT
jgi:hypothetical protein